jgi:hypothetical protein
MEKTTQKHLGAKPLGLAEIGAKPLGLAEIGAKVRSATRAMALDLGQDSASVAPSLCVARDSSSLAAHLLDPVYAFTAVISFRNQKASNFLLLLESCMVSVQLVL